MKASEVLRAGLAKLDGGRGWTQRNYAVNRWGYFVPAHSPSARKFCAVGCLLGFPSYNQLVRNFLSDAAGGLVLTAWNDAPERTYADVEAAFQKAIAIAEAEGN